MWLGRGGYRYCIMGDGCNMEGISNEAASLAGHWGLGKLICFYDDNQISIDGNTEISFTEDVNARYAALGWHTIHVKVPPPSRRWCARATEQGLGTDVSSRSGISTCLLEQTLAEPTHDTARNKNHRPQICTCRGLQARSAWPVFRQIG